MAIAPTTRHTQRPKHRLTTAQRGYDHDWRKLSEAYRDANPLCEDCLDAGYTMLGDDVDHIVPFRSLSDPLRLAWSNLRTRCRPHHARKHAQSNARRLLHAQGGSNFPAPSPQTTVASARGSRQKSKGGR